MSAPPTIVQRHKDAPFLGARNLRAQMSPGKTESNRREKRMNECRLHLINGALARVDSLHKLPGDGHSRTEDRQRPGCFRHVVRSREKKSRSRGMNKYGMIAAPD